ncbi:arylesterase [Pseudomonas sp. Choline-3u-10]|uniref:arylesterase n=1 Tax=Pseudomonadaceae TaxID=135621 RepID=UPI0006181521|nr:MULTISPECIES: arylesterase [Pseudomonadaceae]MBU0948384.1 arylesterase [Gammaproteobacteria bacterium]HBM10879.1 arylesterase [Pseudomonas sp.]KJJ62129.1 esterase [Pseudomonas sp. 10B238]MBK3795307.1 arylesterase [Stutzerimonas stutzeri]MBK3878338.1 arylesterase [Stutzerimonas stutzeri]
MRNWLKGGVLVLLCWAQGALAGTVLVVGDSISAAFGLETSQGWVQLLQQRLDTENLDHRVVNASISGDTSAGGLARLPALLEEYDPEVVIIELGGNDGLRGQPPKQLNQNLAAMVGLSREADAKVVLLGMRLPPNLGQRYTSAFADAFDSLADEQNLPYVPFFLEGVGGVEGMMQADRIHPTASAQQQLLDNVWPVLEPLL